MATAKIMDGKKLAAQLRENFKQRIANLQQNQGLTPGLAVILVGENPASQVYVKNKVLACESVGIHSEKITFEANISEEVLLNKIKELNADPKIHGILVQLPLPPQINENKILAAISINKDVDGFHAENVGLLAQGKPQFISCTPFGVMKMLAAENINVQGLHAVVVGRSNIVGKPMAMLLLNAGATVTVCHSKTQNLHFFTQHADIVIAAVGKANFITADMIKENAVVVDVGINRLENGKLCGDVDFTECSKKAAYISPVPGGVGPMTITMLLENTIISAENSVSK